MRASEIRSTIEAVLFVADEPVSSSELATLLEVPVTEVERHLEELQAAHDDEGRGIVLRRAAGGWRFTTNPAAALYLERFVAENRNPRITQAALETLAIVAYRQPISRGQVAEIRGVSSESVVKTLIARGLIQEVGRDSGPGNAVLYGTTTAFLERMSIDSIDDLPPLPQFMPDNESVEKMEASLGPGL